MTETIADLRGVAALYDRQCASEPIHQLGSVQPNDPQSKVLTKGVIGMAHGLNLITVAEGVETQVQLRWLIEQDCDVGQGYLFSRPVPAEAVALAVVAIESIIWSGS